MEGGALFKARLEAKEQVRAAFAAIDIHKNEVGSYAYNNDNTLVTEPPWQNNCSKIPQTE